MDIISNILPYFKKELRGFINEREIVSIYYIVIENLFDFNRSDSILNYNYRISNKERDHITEIIYDLKRNRPIQYILGKTKFCELDFQVSESVLIPRPETEELVKWIVESAEGNNKFLDIGTGSGCIIISLSKYLTGNFFGIDISLNALEVARENNRINNTNVYFQYLDIINDDFEKNIYFDIIVSNPPYVLESEKKFLGNNVLDFEPHMAIFVHDHDPLFFYAVIANKATNILNKGGLLYFEINERYGNAVCSMLHDLGFVNIQLKKDINDKERMIKATWK